MGDAICILIFGIYTLWEGIATLRHAKKRGPTPFDSLLPLRGRWLRIAWGVSQLLFALLLGLLALVTVALSRGRP